MISEELSCNLFLLSNHFTKHSLLLLEGLFRVKGQAHSLESTHATCHQYCSVNKGKTHFLSTINSWPIDHMQATREKMLPCPAAKLPTVGKAGECESIETAHCSWVCNTGRRYLNFSGKKFFKYECICILITVIIFACTFKKDYMFEKNIYVLGCK